MGRGDQLQARLAADAQRKAMSNETFLAEESLQSIENGLVVACVKWLRPLFPAPQRWFGYRNRVEPRAREEAIWMTHRILRHAEKGPKPLPEKEAHILKDWVRYYEKTREVPHRTAVSGPGPP